MKEAKTQAQTRRAVVAKDQFGRPWGGSIEIESGDFTGIVKPAGWTDPMRTPQKCVSMAKNEYGHPEMGRGPLDLDRWIKDQKQAMTEWIRNFWKVGKELYAARFDPREQSDDAYLLEHAGPKPFPSIQCIEVLQNPNHKAYRALVAEIPMNEAAEIMLGNDPLATRAIERASMTIQEMAAEGAKQHELGLIDFLALHPAYQDLVAWGAANGMGVKEVAEKWRTYKDLMGTDPIDTADQGPPEVEETPDPEPTEAELAELQEAHS